MDGNEVKTAGKRKTKNSTSLAEEEKDLAKAKKESEEHSRQEQELKKKEDDDLRMALAVSKLQVSNDKSLSMSELKAKGKDLSDHLINVQTATSSEPTQLLPLGSVASSSARTNSATTLFSRISQGKEECDLNDQVMDRDDFSPFSSFDEDPKRESSDSLPLDPNTGELTLDASSEEVMSAAVEASSQLQISPEIPEAVRQRHLMEMDAQLNFDKAMANFVREDPKDLNEENKSERRDDCSSSISDVKWGDSVELNSQSSRSQRSDSRCGDSVLSGSSNNSNRSFTKDTYTQLMASADKWTSEEDVILDMRGLCERYIERERIQRARFDTRQSTKQRERDPVVVAP